MLGGKRTETVDTRLASTSQPPEKRTYPTSKAPSWLCLAVCAHMGSCEKHESMNVSRLEGPCFY